ncbi:hypothetical protein VPH35_072891 [Triticum aestivum]
MSSSSSVAVGIIDSGQLCSTLARAQLLHVPNSFVSAGVLVLLQFRKKIFFLRILLVHSTAICLCSRCGAVGRPVTSFSVDFTDFGAGVQVSSLATFAGF